VPGVRRRNGSYGRPPLSAIRVGASLAVTGIMMIMTRIPKYHDSDSEVSEA
jgi:hypothetical protein